MVVAFDTSDWLFASPEITTAPSMPRNSHSVTSMVPDTWPMTSPKLKLSACPSLATPQKASMKVPNWKMVRMSTMKMSTGTILPMVPTTFMTAPLLAPRRASHSMSHVMTEAPMTEAQLLPLPKTPGKK